MIPLKVLTVARPRQLSEVVKAEVHPDICRESGTLLAGEAVDLGTVLGMVAATGKLVPLDPTAADGSQNVEGVSQVAIEVGEEDSDGLVYSARLTVLSAAGLRWPAGMTDVQTAAALAQMKALGLIVRGF